MMRKLILFRHAKAVPGNGLQDFDRALADKGRADASEMGRWLTQNGLDPQFALVSSARRTQETWELAASALSKPANLRLDKKLYESSPRQILSCIQSAPESIGTLIVVGHNPGLEELALRLGRIGSPSARRALEEGFPPGAIAVFAIKSDDWESLTPEDGELLHFVTPKSREVAG